MECPSCNRENAEDAKFCNNCATPLISEEARQESQTHTTGNPENMVCNDCGTQLQIEETEIRGESAAESQLNL